MWKFVLILFFMPNFLLAAVEPQATFHIEDGFIHVAVTRDGSTPVRVQVKVTTNGGHWAEGETDDAGKCEIPKPSTPTCEIAFDIDGTATPPVVLTFVDDGKNVVPLVAPLIPGPCCKIPKLVSAETDFSDPPTSNVRWDIWLPVMLGSGLVLLVTLKRFWWSA